jgi:hypothetical protein
MKLLFFYKLAKETPIEVSIQPDEEGLSVKKTNLIHDDDTKGIKHQEVKVGPGLFKKKHKEVKVKKDDGESSIVQSVSMESSNSNV